MINYDTTLLNDFNIDDSFWFDLKFDDSCLELDPSSASDYSWIDSFQKISESNTFIVAHLNTNSIFNKFVHALNILNTGCCDLLFIDESKLDSTVPDDN